MTFESLDDLAPYKFLTTPVWIFDVDRSEMWWGNRGAIDFWGVGDLDALRALDFSKVSSVVRQRFRRAAQADAPDSKIEETWTFCPQGTTRAVSAKMLPVRIDDGRNAVLCEVTSDVDISRDSAAARLLEAARVSPLLISSFRDNGELLAQNAAAAAAYGVARPEEFEGGASLLERYEDDALVGRLIEVLKTDTPLKIDAQVSTADGMRWHRLYAARGREHLGGGPTLIVIEDDITALRSAEAAVRRIRAAAEARMREDARLSSARLRAAIEAIPDGFSLFDAEDRLVLFNQQYRESYAICADAIHIGSRYEDMLRMGVQRGQFADAVGREEEWIARRMEQHRNPDGPIEQRLSDGRWLLVLEKRTPHGETVGLRVDITDLKSLQHTLQVSESRFRDFAHSSADWFWETDADLRFTYLSENVERIIGVRPEWHYGKTVQEMRGADHDAEAWAAHQAVLDAHEPFRNFEYLREVEGSDPRWLRISGVPVFDQRGVFLGYRGAALDITKKKMALERLMASEAQLFQAQKMEAVGQLTGGVAHDFNNLLAVIQGNLELIEEEIDSPEMKEMIEASLRAVSRGARVAGQLLAFGRRALLTPVPLQLNEQLTSMGGMLRLTLPRSIEIETDYAEDAWPVELDPAQFEAAVLNVVINARDAMPKGGTLTISTGNLLLAEGDEVQGAASLDPGHYAVVTISDTGSGMCAETVAQAFDPFYTTKPFGQGSGLGLSMVHGFVHQSGGGVVINSVPGEGAAIRMYFPAKSQSEILPMPPERLQPMQSSKGETILVTEDEDDVRRTVVAQLRSFGYKVIEASSGAEGLSVLKSDQSIDLLITDMIMPGVPQGGELAQLARKMRPDIKIAFMTGLPSRVQEEDSGFESGDLMLKKPVTKAVLARAIWKILNDGSDRHKQSQSGH